MGAKNGLNARTFYGFRCLNTYELKGILTDILSVISIASGEVDLQWLEPLWNHENMFKTREDQANES